jgi:hypothetical protein
VIAQADRSILVAALLGGIVPAVSAAAVLVAERVLGARNAAAGWGTPLAIGLAVTSGYVVLLGWPPIAREMSVKPWVFYTALVGGLLGTYEVLAERRGKRLRWMLSLALPFCLLGFMRRYHWGVTEATLWTGGLGALLFAEWLAAEALEPRPAWTARIAGWATCTALAGGAYAFSGSRDLGQLAGTLAVALGVCAIVALRRPDGTHPVVGTTLLVYMALLWAARFASELSWTSFALLSLAPLATWGSELFPAGHRRLRAALALVLPALLSGLALAIEIARTPPATPYG